MDVNKAPKWVDYVPVLSMYSGGKRIFAGFAKLLTDKKTGSVAKSTFEQNHRKWSGVSDIGRGVVALIPVGGNLILGCYDGIKALFSSDKSPQEIKIQKSPDLQDQSPPSQDQPLVIEQWKVDEVDEFDEEDLKAFKNLGWSVNDPFYGRVAEHISPRELFDHEITKKAVSSQLGGESSSSAEDEDKLYRFAEKWDKAQKSQFRLKGVTLEPDEDLDLDHNWQKRQIAEINKQTEALSPEDKKTLLDLGWDLKNLNRKEKRCFYGCIETLPIETIIKHQIKFQDVNELFKPNQFDLQAFEDALNALVESHVD